MFTQEEMTIYQFGCQKLPEAEIRDIDHTQSRDVDRGDKISW